MSSQRAELREDLLDYGEAFPVAAQAYVFCKYLVRDAKTLSLSSFEVLDSVQDAIESKTIMYEDRMALRPPPQKTIDQFDRFVRERLAQFSARPTYESLVALRECIVVVATKRGAPPALIEALLKHFWYGVDLVTLTFKKENGGDGGSDLNGFKGVPSWIRRPHEA